VKRDLVQDPVQDKTYINQQLNFYKREGAQGAQVDLKTFPCEKNNFKKYFSNLHFSAGLDG